MVDPLFTCLHVICMSSLKKCLLGLLPIFQLGCLFLLLNCMNYLYILEIKLLVMFANIFSQSMGCLFFFFFCLCFPLQKLANLISFFNFCFYIYCLGRMALERFAYVLF